MYDFTAAIEDALITHALRDSNWTQRVELQDFIRKKCGIKENPVNVLYSRYQIEGGVTQGRVIRKLVEDKLVQGYDDIRLSTVKAFLRKGIRVETLRELLVELGISKSKRTIPTDKIYSINKKFLEKIANHYLAVKADDSMSLNVKNCPTKLSVPLNSFSDKKIDVKLTGEFVISKISKEDKVIRLKNGFNVKIVSLDSKQAAGEYDKGELTKEIKIVSWVSNNNVKVNILEGKPLFNDKEELNPDSLITHQLIIESFVNELPKGTITYFERFGFCKKEEKQWIFVHE